MPTLRLDEDMHVHSTFSDGKNTLRENISSAIDLGVRRMGCVDHVRRDTDWVPEFVSAVRKLRSSALELSIGVETKLLDVSGALDLPERLKGVDYVYVADHQFPLLGRCVPPRTAREMLAEGKTTPGALVGTLLEAYFNMLSRGRRPVVLAHLFSILPRIGIPEDSVPLPLLRQLADAAAQRGAIIEVDERWRCPNARTVRIFRDAGVRVFASSDSHEAATIGRYRFVAEVALQLAELAA